jgi:hypothetical protein
MIQEKLNHYKGVISFGDCWRKFSIHGMTGFRIFKSQTTEVCHRLVLPERTNSCSKLKNPVWGENYVGSGKRICPNRMPTQKEKKGAKPS